MTTLIDAAPPPFQNHDAELAVAVLNEIAERLARFVSDGVESLLDLRSLPLSDGALSLLRDALGTGEVIVTIDAAGTSQAWETRVSGVWWIRHEGAEGKLALEQVAVTACPDILKSHPADVSAARGRLAEIVEELAAGAAQGSQP